MENEIAFLIFKRILGMDEHQNFDLEVFEPERIENASSNSNEGILNFKYNGKNISIKIIVN